LRIIGRHTHFALDPAEKGQTYYAGSTCFLTTAFCIAAISLFQKHTLEINSQGKNIEANIYVKKYSTVNY